MTKPKTGPNRKAVQTKQGPKTFEIVKFKTGRPPKYKTIKDLEKKIDEYFNGGMNCREVIVKDTIIKVPTPTMVGLTLFLGFAEVSALQAMEADPRYMHLIKKARAAIQRHYEENLNTSSCTGSIFWLKNWAGYKDKTEQETTISIKDYRIEFGNTELLTDGTNKDNNANITFGTSEDNKESL